MYKVLYITNLPAPYKVSFFELLSKDVVLTVAYEREKAADRDVKWTSKEKRHFKEIYLNSIDIGNESSLSFQVINILNKEKYDIVITNGYSSPTAVIAIIYMRIKKIKYAIMCDGMLPTKSSWLIRKLKKYLISGAFLYLSPNVVTDEQLMISGAKRNRIFRYPFGSLNDADIEYLSYDKKEFKNLIGAKSKYMVLYVGQFIYRKGIDILLETFSNFDKDVELFMVGGTEQDLSSFNGVENNRIKCCGFKTKEEIKNYYKAADIFVLPTREDIWGLVVNEAMSFGLPVITTKNCGAGLEMIGEKEGIIISNIDSRSLLNAIDFVLNNINNYDNFKIREKSVNYTIEKMTSRVFDILVRELK